jgi:glycosyltransferase involved in cell wall biosynthesis
VRFVVERLYFLPYERNKSFRFAFSPAFAGLSLSEHPRLANAEIVHLHWFNQGYMHLGGLKKIMLSGKKVVWTLHDMWAFTGGCHYAGTCEAYKQSCGNCPMLRNPTPNDLSHSIHQAKQYITQNKNLTIVCCSNWLAQKARQSSLLQGNRIVAIPNAIDTQHYTPRNQELIRDKYSIPEYAKVLLFGAANIDDKRKGFKYILQLIDSLLTNDPDNEYQLILFGKASPETLAQIRLKYLHFPYAGQDILPEIYSAADVMLLPSLQDNLPNTVMESLSCGTPVIAFNTGGVPEMLVEGKTGYIVPDRNAEIMAQKVTEIFRDGHMREMRPSCRAFAVEHYSPEVVAAQYLQIYKS